MTLNGVIPNLCVISPNSVAFRFRTDYVKMVGDTSIFSAAIMYTKNQVFSDITYGDTGRGSPIARALKLGTRERELTLM